MTTAKDTEEYLQKHLRDEKIDGSKESKGKDIERKQVVPISRGDTQCKCIHIADGSKKKSICTMAKIKESLLAKIKLMTGEQMHILNNDFFNQEVERLKRRVGQVECTMTHEEKVKTSLQKVSKLKKEVNAILAVQEETSAAARVPQVGDADPEPPGALMPNGN